jgi:pimeloyl-ACP methyl ester carboxylesterase
MAYAPIILVPGFWLGGWAWDDVAAALRADGHDVTALTLPGLESPDADRSAIRMSDHVDAICQAVTAAGRPVVLAVHSGASVPGYGASDRVPGQIAAMVYVDTGPSANAIDADFDDAEKPLPPWDELDENLDGISQQQLETFRERALPEPGAAIREGTDLRNEARLDIPSTVICSAFSSDEYKTAAAEGVPFLSGLAEVRNVTYVDLPTSHWPMWSRPQELAAIIGHISRRVTATEPS